ncbi:MAG: DRTGG domain-containing protein [Angelakisella sp.]
MTLHEIRDILDAQVLYGDELMDEEIHTACGSDMMSDVLAYVKDQAVLLTGLMNQQVIRTAEMMDMLCVVFVRDKKPDEAIIALAKEKGIAVMTTHHRMFMSCGLLYQAGLKGGLHRHE